MVGCVPPPEKPRRLLSNPVPKVRHLNNDPQPRDYSPPPPTIHIHTRCEEVDAEGKGGPGADSPAGSSWISAAYSVGSVEGPTRLEYFLFSSYLVRDPLARLLRIWKWPLRVDTTGVVLLTNGSLLVAGLAIGFSVDKSGCWCFVLGDTIVGLSAVPWFLSCMPLVARTAAPGVDSVPWRADSNWKPWPWLAA